MLFIYSWYILEIKKNIDIVFKPYDPKFQDMSLVSEVREYFGHIPETKAAIFIGPPYMKPPI